MKKKINFKQPKYIFPLIGLPFILFIGWKITDLISSDVEEQKAVEEIATSLGTVEEEILSKNEAYDKLFDNRRESRSMIQEFDRETDSLFQYSDNLDDQQRRFIDSLKYERKKEAEEASKISSNQSFYRPNERIEQSSDEDKDFERSKEIIKMLNDSQREEKVVEEKETYDPVKAMREQMLFLDSLEKSKDPEQKALMEAQRRLRENKEKMDAFLNRTLDVSKSQKVNGFNHISRNGDDTMIKAVIDENIKGYLGSRIRIRLLEDVFIGKHKVKKGTFLYAEISGFTQQRVNLSVISVMANNEILPINLSIYDTDGIKGLYVPASAYREMLRQLGSNSVQGMNMEGGTQGFFTSMASSLFRSASQSVAAIIRSNKVSVKYNTYLFLINEKDLKNE
ncbi:MAG: conjugative transposon protein TraM [Capnocytophaga sp.]|nr:conjugative transposon protein TraM [Capnocytophaga sp.]